MLSQHHPLNNPAWHALLSGNAALSQGNDYVKKFPENVSPIVGMMTYDNDHFNHLYQLADADRPVVLFSVDELSIPANWNQLVCLQGRQMTYEQTAIPPLQGDMDIVTLSEDHIPQMLTLTKLTNPGPFSSRTIDFGRYEGIIINGRLAAMAGQRLQPLPYIEISAVCTHPDFAGKGYARQLLLRQVHYILSAGNVPFLHVRSDNHNAIRLYETLGFTTRTIVQFYVLQKTG